VRRERFVQGAALATLVAIAALFVAGCGSGGSAHTTATPPPEQARLAFDYRTSAPLRYVDRGVVAREGAIDVHDVAFTSSGQRVDGYLVEQPGRRRRPAVVLVHGSGGDRRQLLGTAVAMCKHGAVALTITAPSSAHPPAATGSVQTLLAASTAETVHDVVAVRRAADLLSSLANVDVSRLGYLGWSAGAKLGTFVAASDARFKALALLSAGADKLSAFVAAAPAQLRPLVERDLGSIDPLRYLAAAGAGKLLLEDGTRDTVIPHHALVNVVRAAPPRTTVRWYRAGHALTAKAFTDATVWLAQRLGGG
jgi:dienelactone hydrolase